MQKPKIQIECGETLYHNLYYKETVEVYLQSKDKFLREQASMTPSEREQWVVSLKNMHDQLKRSEKLVEQYAHMLPILYS